MDTFLRESIQYLPSTTQKPIVNTMTDEIYRSISENIMNKEVTFRGIAMDAKGGAVIILFEGEVVYLQNMDCWDDDMLNRGVLVKGLLVRRKLIPDPVVAKDGAISSGAYGTQFVLENVKIIQKE